MCEDIFTILSKVISKLHILEGITKVVPINYTLKIFHGEQLHKNRIFFVLI